MIKQNTYLSLFNIREELKVLYLGFNLTLDASSFPGVSNLFLSFGLLKLTIAVL